MTWKISETFENNSKKFDFKLKKEFNDNNWMF